jgi:glycerophosphoryl diester phosphodiesterase
VLKTFPRTPINLEIKGRTPQEATEEYVKNARVLARLFRRTAHRRLIVVSFKQAAVDRFHELAPKIDLAPGTEGAASWLLSDASPGPRVVAFQVPVTYTTGGATLKVTTRENVARAHTEGYAWQNWVSDEDSDSPATWRRLIDMCVDGTMTSRPKAYERVLEKHARPASRAG